MDTDVINTDDASSTQSEAKEELSVVQLVYCEAAVNFIHRFFHEPSIWRNLCDDDMNAAFVYDFIDHFRSGRNLCFVPAVGTEAIGMFYCYFMNASILEAHQGVFAKYRKKWSMKAVKACTEKGFEVTGAHSAMGLIPVENKPSVYCAQHAGFKIQGKIRDYYKIDGKLKDVYILIKERDNA